MADTAPRQTTFIVDVYRMSDLHALDPRDRGAHGLCDLEGAYAVTLSGDLPDNPSERVFDLFDQNGPLTRPGDFWRTVRRIDGSAEAEGAQDLKAHIGTFIGADPAAQEVFAFPRA